MLRGFGTVCCPVQISLTRGNPIKGQLGEGGGDGSGGGGRHEMTLLILLYADGRGKLRFVRTNRQIGEDVWRRHNNK